MTVALSSFPQDLATPPVTEGRPGPGLRVRQALPGYEGTAVHHTLYLPVDWEPGLRFPVIVEYAGNCYGSSPGTVEGSNLGYGLSGGRGFIWACLPFVDTVTLENTRHWWGDVGATRDYAKQAVSLICTHYGGDPAAVILAGFSRGAIACNYIGLHDESIAGLWRAFICHSHYDAGQDWIPYAGYERAGAPARLTRLEGRPQLISHEKRVEPDTLAFLKRHAPDGHFTILPLPFADHTDTWVLRESPGREAARAWLRTVIHGTG